MSDSCNPMDYSLSGSSVHGIVQARILEWVDISFSRESSQPFSSLYDFVKILLLFYVFGFMAVKHVGLAPQPGMETAWRALKDEVIFFSVDIQRSFYLFMVALSLLAFAWAFSSYREWGLLSFAVCELLITIASLVAEYRL